MENKYYQPTLDEFHVGFEYEELINNDMLSIRPDNHVDDIQWYKTKLSDNYISFGELPSKIKYEQVRVKYLDKEDIESLGFEKEFIYINKRGGIQDRYYPLEIKIGPVDETKVRFRLRSYDNNKITIEKADWDLRFYGDFIFIGYIKNKSELNKLIKQLDIL